jgi:uncharacterized protein (TIRG00374 family)
MGAPSPDPQGTPAAAKAPRRGLLRALLSWALALAALTFVAWQVPVRDRCWDPLAAASTHVAVSRDDAGCVLHLSSGAVHVSPAECSHLRCEPGVVSTFAGAKGGLVAALFVVYLLGTLVWAARWRALLSFAGVDLQLLHVWRIVTEAQAGGVLLPGGLGGDALRVASVVSLPDRPGAGRAPTSIVIASVLLDRAIGLSLIAAVAATMGLVWGRAQAGWLVVALAAIPAGVLAGLFVLRRLPLERMRGLLESRVGRALSPVLSYVRDPRAPTAMVRAAGLSLVVAVIQFVCIRGLVTALGATPTAEKWVYVGTAMAFIVSALPTLPGGWGTADAAYVFFFGLGGLTAGTALGVCLLFRLFWYLVAMGGAVLYVARSRSARPAGAVEAGAASSTAKP